MENQVIYQPYIPEKKKYKPVDKKDIIFMILFFVSAFLMVCLGLWGELRLGFTIAYFVLFGVSTAYLFKKPNAFAITCGVLSLAGSVTFALYNDYFINAIMLLLVAGLYATYVMGISDTFNYKQGSFKIIIDLFFGVIIHTFDSLSDVFGGIKAYAGERKKSLAGLIGALIALPVLVVVVPLLASSDAAFEGLVKGVIENVGIALIQLVIALALTPFLFSFVYEKRNQLNKKATTKSAKSKGAPASACTSFLAVISVVYVVYLFSQLAYFFSAFKGILPSDYHYTASAFARRGFFEMFAICVINVAIISFASMLTNKKSLLIKLLSTFISAFSVLLIVVAMQKMRLNISIYGLSKNRVMVSVFMLMLLVIIAFFILHIYAPKISYMQPIIIICSAMFIALSFSNIDARIAEYNINAYESGQIEALDIETLANLSDSSIPYVVELMENEDNQIANEATRIVVNLKEYTYNEEEDAFRSYNLAHKKAVEAINSANTPLLENILSITDKADWYDYDESTDTYHVYNDNDGSHIEYKLNAKTNLYETNGERYDMDNEIIR